MGLIGKYSRTVVSRGKGNKGDKGESPIIFIRERACRALVDSDANCSLVDRTVLLNKLELGKVTKCKCELLTLSGKRALEGEVVLNIEPIGGLNGLKRFHVTDFN